MQSTIQQHSHGICHVCKLFPSLCKILQECLFEQNKKEGMTKFSGIIAYNLVLVFWGYFLAIFMCVPNRDGTILVSTYLMT